MEEVMKKEIIEGIKVVKQLRNQILTPNSKGEHQLTLVDKMLSSFENTIAMAKMLPIHHIPLNLNHINNPPPTQNSSHQRCSVSKRRKTMPQLTKRVQVCGERSNNSGMENPLDDGYSWRKYGQKAILGAKYPRGYYRCTHRHTQGCGATRQVQRLDQEQSIYQIIYHGEHTCVHGPQKFKAQQDAAILAQPNSDPEPRSIQNPQLQYQSVQSPQPQPEIFFGLGQDGNIKVETENEAQMFGSISLPSPTLEDWPIDNNSLSYFPSFAPPTTSESIQLYPLFSSYQNTGSSTGMNCPWLDFEINGITSGSNLVTNLPIIVDQQLDIDANFMFK